MVELRILVSPLGQVVRDRRPSAVMSWMYAPWQEARQSGVIKTEIEGETLRSLLAELSERYKNAGIDFEPIDPRTNEVDIDYDVYLNDKTYEVVPHRLDIRLREGDEVVIKLLWKMDG